VTKLKTNRNETVNIFLGVRRRFGHKMLWDTKKAP
jgi:hypothetical protein